MEGQNKHFSHTHNLTIHHIPVGSEITCSGCNFSGTATVYACWQCNFFLHEQCFHATRSLQHPSHPSHPLTLLPFPTYPSNSYFCNSCNQAGTGFTYCCSDCEFDLHVQCAYSVSLPSHLIPDTHIFPHQIQPPNHTPGINLQTGNIPHETALNQQIHFQNPPNQHSMSTLTQSYPPVNAPSYYHLPQHIPSNHMENYTPINETLPQPNTPQAVSHNPINSNAPITASPPSRTGQVEARGHFSHSHVLYLVNPEEGEDSTKCSSCAEVISGSRYSCSKSSCDFHLDKSCFELSQILQHKSHPKHPLILLPCPYEGGKFSCSACNNDGVGFAYHCATCKFDLHIKCATLQETFKRDDHDHPLKLFYSCPYNDQKYSCGICHEPIQEDFWGYYCEKCDVSTHVDCVNGEVCPVREPESSTGDPVLDAQIRMQRIQLQMQMARQNALFMIGCGNSLANLA